MTLSRNSYWHDEEHRRIIAQEGIVTSLNALNGDITLAAGTGVSLASSGQTLTLANTGVLDISGVTGSIQLLANAGISLSAGHPFYIGNAGVLSVASLTGSVGLIAGTGIDITISGNDLTVTNTSPASSVPNASATVIGITKLSVAPVSSSNPIACGDNDSRMTNSRTPTGSAGGVLAGAYPNPSLAQDRVNLQASPPAAAQTGGDWLTGTRKGEFDALSQFSLGGTIWIKTGSFPGSPTNGQHHYAAYPTGPSTGVEHFVFDSGLGLWLSDEKVITLQSQNPVNPLAEATQTFDGSVPIVDGGPGWLLIRLHRLIYMDISQDDFYDWTLTAFADGSGSTISLTVPQNTSNLSGSTWYNMVDLYSDPDINNSFGGLELVAIPHSGNPGTFKCFATAVYRLVSS